MIVIPPHNSKRFVLQVQAGAQNYDLKMEVDTGAFLSIISKATYQSLWVAKLKTPVKTTDIKLHTYTKESLQVLGLIEIG